MSTHFNIDYSGWSDEASPIKNDVKINVSHGKLVANGQIATRNKDKKHREAVSKGLKKYFGTASERFFDLVVKQKNGCWIYPKRWIMDDDGLQQQPKNFSATIHKIKFQSGCITQTCGNKKCVNPKHLKDYPKEQQALDTISKRKVIKGDTHHQSKLSEKERKQIKKIYESLFKKTGKKKGIASLIQKQYPYVSLSRICQIIKE